jgi:hypothetical protein
MRIRRRNLRDAFAAVAVTGLVLTSSVIGYVVVNRPNWIGMGPEEPAPAAAPAAPTPPAAVPAPPAAAAPQAPPAAPGEAG